jgi:hypothetical protein
MGITLGSDIVTGLRRYSRPLLTYHLFFSGLMLAIVAPRHGHGDGPPRQFAEGA